MPPTAATTLPLATRAFNRATIKQPVNKMSEIAELKNRIDKSGIYGIATAQIRADYEPIGGKMINDLVETGKYITARVEKGDFNSEWRIFQAELAGLIREI